MKQSTKWWIAVVAMLLVGAVVAQIGVVSHIAYRATPLGLATAAAALLGTMAAFAIIPLVVGAITRFRWPWVVLGLYVVCAGLAVVGIHNNVVDREAAMVGRGSVASTPDAIGTFQAGTGSIAGEWRCTDTRLNGTYRLILHSDGSVSSNYALGSMFHDPWMHWYLPPTQSDTTKPVELLRIRVRDRNDIVVQYPSTKIDRCVR